MMESSKNIIDDIFFVTVLNVAAGKAPMQISSEPGGIPQKAIDGSTSSFFNSETCTLTKPERLPWWYVNLLEPYMVQLVRLDFGKSCCGTYSPLVGFLHPAKFNFFFSYWPIRNTRLFYILNREKF